MTRMFQSFAYVEVDIICPVSVMMSLRLEDHFWLIPLNAFDWEFVHQVFDKWPKFWQNNWLRYGRLSIYVGVYINIEICVMSSICADIYC